MASILDERFEQQLDDAVGGNLITASHEDRKIKYGWSYRSASHGQYPRPGFYFAFIPEPGFTHKCELRIKRGAKHASLLIKSYKIRNKNQRKTVKVRTMAEVIDAVEKIGIVIPSHHNWARIWDC